MKNKIQDYQSREVWFTGPNQVEVREAKIKKPSPLEAVVSTRYSAISAGSELLLYRGEMPSNIILDSSIESLKDVAGYPTKYGYACVGEVIDIGEQIESSWLGRKVFCFHPHIRFFVYFLIFCKKLFLGSAVLATSILTIPICLSDSIFFLKSLKLLYSNV